MEEYRNTYRVLVGKHEGRRPLEDLGVYDNTKMDPKEIGWKVWT
jgi:hypothetical protein